LSVIKFTLLMISTSKILIPATPTWNFYKLNYNQKRHFRFVYRLESMLESSRGQIGLDIRGHW
ncbi:MAG: hypothetical protein XD73_0760, partial [Anaerolinea thermophila]